MLHRQFSIFLSATYVHLYRWNVHTQKHTNKHMCECASPSTSLRRIFMHTNGCKKILIKYIVVHLGYELRVSTDAGLYLTKTARVIVFQSAVKAYVCSFSTLLQLFSTGIVYMVSIVSLSNYPYLVRRVPPCYSTTLFSAVECFVYGYWVLCMFFSLESKSISIFERSLVQT